LVSPFSTGIFDTIPWIGVIRCSPPWKDRTLFLPMELSNCSTKPLCDASLISFKLSYKSSNGSKGYSFISTADTLTPPYDFAPAEFKNSLSKSKMVLPLHINLKRLSFVTLATTLTSRFSLLHPSMKSSIFSLAITTAILSWDSLIESSVPSNPSYFFGIKSRLTSTESAISPIATETPPAPKSLLLLIKPLILGFLNNLCIFRSIGGLPFCTSAPETSIDFWSCILEDPVAPPTPSRPVLPPTTTTKSPSAGTSLKTSFLGVAPITNPTSILLARKPWL